MENIISLDCLPSPAIKTMMANFSSGMSTLCDSELKPLDVGPQVFLRSLLYGQQVVARLSVHLGLEEVGHKRNGEFLKG